MRQKSLTKILHTKVVKYTCAHRFWPSFVWSFISVHTNARGVSRQKIATFDLVHFYIFYVFFYTNTHTKSHKLKPMWKHNERVLRPQNTCRQLKSAISTARNPLMGEQENITDFQSLKINRHTDNIDWAVNSSPQMSKFTNPWCSCLLRDAFDFSVMCWVHRITVTPCAIWQWEIFFRKECKKSRYRMNHMKCDERGGRWGGEHFLKQTVSKTNVFTFLIL